MPLCKISIQVLPIGGHDEEQQGPAHGIGGPHVGYGDAGRLDPQNPQHPERTGSQQVDEHGGKSDAEAPDTPYQHVSQSEHRIECDRPVELPGAGCHHPGIHIEDADEAACQEIDDDGRHHAQGPGQAQT